jgi:hypothetical protein
MFKDFTGPDATSIWAAATSGQAAIAVHLLACMLARVWPPAEAISIWLELINGQQREIQEKYNNGAETFERLLAALPKIDHADVADWDNSARAWIRRADEVKQKEQTQVKLILTNLDIPVGLSEKTLNSVLDSWKTALLGMESLLNQRSQVIQDGSLALALSAWHLYPNLDVPGIKHVVQGDTLFSPEVEAVLGLEPAPSQQARGVYWSLSLSKLRFYGAPEQTTQTFRLETSRLTLEQLRFVVLGSVLRGWTFDGTSLNKAAHLMSNLYHLAYKESKDANQVPWLEVLAEAADDFLHAANEQDRNIMVKLMTLAKGPSKNILGAERHPAAVFGLTKVENLLNILQNDKNRVELLCRIAKRLFPGALPGDVIIAIVDETLPSSHECYQNAERRLQVPVVPADPLAGTTTPGPSPEDRDGSQALGEVDMSGGQKQNARLHSSRLSDETDSTDSSDEPAASQHIYKRRKPAPTARPSLNNESSEQAQSTEHNNLSLSETRADVPQVNLPDDDGESDTRSFGRTTAGFITALHDSDGLRHLWISSSAMGSALEKDMSEVADLQTHELPQGLLVTGHNSDESVLGPVVKEALPHIHALSPSLKVTPSDKLSYEYFFVGEESEEADEETDDDQDSVRSTKDGPSVSKQPLAQENTSQSRIAMFVNKRVLEKHRSVKKQPFWIRQKILARAITCDDVDSALKNGTLHIERLRRSVTSHILETQKATECQTYWRSLVALSMIESVYRGFPGATIDPVIIREPLCSAKWFANQRQVLVARSDLSRSEAFGCIGYLEGGLDAELQTYRDVMALSSGDSIYVAAALVADPLHMPRKKTVIKRLLGNIGRPGISLLVPPPNPMSMEVDSDSWLLTDLEPYSGHLEDKFNNTSLRMSFTDWSLPIHVAGAPTGRPFTQAHIVETLISVYDRGRWIADIDVLDAASKGAGAWDHQWFFKRGCNHDDHDQQRELEMTALGTWEGFFSQPLENPTVALTYKNWEARLAMVALAVRRGYRVLLSDGVCWNCYKDLYSLGGPDVMSRALFIA